MNEHENAAGAQKHSLLNTVCAETPVHLLLKSKHNMKNILSIRLFVESRPCIIRVKNNFFLPNTKSLILTCEPSSLKGYVSVSGS